MVGIHKPLSSRKNNNFRLFTSIRLYLMVRASPKEGTLTMKSKKKVKAAKKVRKQAAPKQAQTRSKAARSSIAKGTRLFAVAGRPTKAQFIKVYGPNGPKMTWAQRAEAGVDAKHFQEELKAKS
jgi:murein L,D-transpeptidase YcbB/YkuD